MRLDIYISRHYPRITRSQAKRLVENGNVKVGGVVFIKVSHEVKEGADVKIDFPPLVVPLAKPEKIPLEILYEDSDIIVVNKPAGMVVHPAAGNPSGTLVNALLYHCRDLSGIGGCLRPGIVHRLDKGTSGVIVAAKNDSAHLNLSNQFKARMVEKKYYALLYGRLPKDEGVILAPIGRHVSDRKKMSTKTKKGRIAETGFKVIKHFGDELTFVDIKLKTGRTHQIRVHFSHLGHPLVGDKLYGGGKTAKRLPFSRPFLHSYKLSFDHPRTGKRIEFTSEMPADMANLLKKLNHFHLEGQAA